MPTRRKLTRADLIKFLRNHKDFFREKYGFKQIYIFGSYAKNKQHPKSDIDLLVDAIKEKKTYDNYFDAQSFLQKQLHTKVDLVYSDSINPVIALSIKEERIKIE